MGVSTDKNGAHHSPPPAGSVDAEKHKAGLDRFPSFKSTWDAHGDIWAFRELECFVASSADAVIEHTKRYVNKFYF